MEYYSETIPNVDPLENNVNNIDFCREFGINLHFVDREQTALRKAYYRNLLISLRNNELLANAIADSKIAITCKEEQKALEDAMVSLLKEIDAIVQYCKIRGGF